MNRPELSRRNRMPLYLQLAKLMRQKIENREWVLGQQIPTLDELEVEYGVSRITLRGALNYLEEFGIIRRTRGQGTFVTKDLSEDRWYKLANTFQELASKVAELDVRLLQIEQSERPPVPAFPYGQVGKAYRCLKRVHYHRDIPYCVIDIFLDKAIFDSDPHGFSTSPAIKLLAARPDIVIGGARQIMRVTVADEDTAGHLGIGVGEPIADVCRTLVDTQNRILYYAHIRYPSNMIQIETDLMPYAGSAAPAARPRKPAPVAKAAEARAAQGKQARAGQGKQVRATQGRQAADDPSAPRPAHDRAQGGRGG